MKKQVTLIAIATILIMTSCGSGSNTSNESTTVIDNWCKGGNK